MKERARPLWKPRPLVLTPPEQSALDELQEERKELAEACEHAELLTARADRVLVRMRKGVSPSRDMLLRPAACVKPKAVGPLAKDTFNWEDVLSDMILALDEIELSCSHRLGFALKSAKEIALAQARVLPASYFLLVIS